MNTEREIVRKSIPVKSSSYFEILKMSIWSGYETGVNRVLVACESPKSPISIRLEIDENSQDFRDLVTESMSVTRECAAVALSEARHEQKRNAGNHSINSSLNTERTLGSLVLAHFSPRIDFSFGMLSPETVDSLKFLALEHTYSGDHLFENDLITTA